MTDKGLALEPEADELPRVHDGAAVPPPGFRANLAPCGVFPFKIQARQARIA
jgi:hypothetical protein